MKIALHGIAGSGKDTVASIITKYYPELTSAAFADELKLVVQTLFFNFTREHTYGSLKEILTTAYVTRHSRKAAEVVFNRHYGKYLVFSEVYASLIQTLHGKTFVTSNGVSIVNTSPRELLQVLGTKVMREMDSEVHIKVLMDKQPNIITDVRFDNEAQAASNNGYIIVHIIGDHRPTKFKCVSEQGINPKLVDSVIYNTSSLAHLEEEVKQIIGIW